MAQLAEMGIAIPDEFRGDIALAGDWKVVSERVIEDENEKSTKDASKSIGVRKRKHEGGNNDDDEDGEDSAPIRFTSSKTWGSAVKEYPDAHRDKDDDLDALLESTRKNIRPSAATNNDANAGTLPTDQGLEPEAAARESHPKEEEDEGSSSIAAAAAASSAVPEVVFKKRKLKAVRK